MTEHASSSPLRSGRTSMQMTVASQGRSASALAGALSGNGSFVLESARIALAAGKPVIIANGRTPQVLERIVAGEAVGTRFAAAPIEVLR